jgi:hypothetical protein
LYSWALAEAARAQVAAAATTPIVVLMNALRDDPEAGMAVSPSRWSVFRRSGCRFGVKTRQIKNQGQRSDFEDIGSRTWLNDIRSLVTGQWMASSGLLVTYPLPE